MRKTIPFTVLLSGIFLVAACKKDDSTTTLPTIYGIAVNDPAPFVREGTSLDFSVDISGIYTSDNTDPGTLGAFWTVNGGDKDTLSRDLGKSNPTFHVTAGDVGNYTVMVTVYATSGNYYNAASSVAFQVIDPETALTGMEGKEDTEIGGNLYRVIEAGSQTWMGNNLYGTYSGRDYRDCEVVSTLFGRYFSWEEAQEACPEGWRLPTGKEFDDALGAEAGDLMVNASFLDVAMWTYWPQVAITNKLKFNAIPTGYIDLATAQEVFGYREYACWWTADEDEDENTGVFRYIHQEEPLVMKGTADKKTLALNVRCVKQAKED